MTGPRLPTRGAAPNPSEMLSPPDENTDSPDSKTQPANGKLLQCEQCDRGFTRPSHLNRHRLTHLPPSRRNIIPCPRCTKQFSRHDVLLRHLRAAHDVDVGPKATYQKSCFRCVRKKLKCDREMPCRSCAVATTGEPCEYPPPDGQGTGNSRNTTPEASSARHSSPAPFNAAKDDLMGDAKVTPAPPVPMQAPTMSQVQQQPPFPGVAAPAPAGFAGIPHPTQMVRQPSMNAVVGSTMMDSPGMMNLMPPATSAPIPDDFAFPSDISSMGQVDFRGSGFNWLELDLPDMDIGMNYNMGIPDIATTPLVSNPLGPSLPAVDPLPSVERRMSILPWPFEQERHESPAAQYPLPSLREVLQQTVHQGGAKKDPAIEGLAQLFSEHYLPQRDDLIDGKAAQGLDLLKSLLDNFFTGFLIIQPLVHTPTWNMAECPTIMLAAMACLGAIYSDNPNAAELAASISDLCTRMINWLVCFTSVPSMRASDGAAEQGTTQGFSDNSSYSNISYLTTLCLHQIYSLGSGNRQLYQNADRTRGVLIGSLRGLDLLSGRLRMHSSDDNSASKPVQPVKDLKQEWLRWVATERDSRITWASFEYDCSLCTLTNRRGAVDLSELPSNLPCSESLWEAPAAEAWAALRARMPADASGPKLSTLLDAVLRGGLAPDYTSVWSKRLCSQVVGRLLWDLKQLETLSGREYFGLPSLFSAQQQSKAPMLLGLDGLLASLGQPVSTLDLVSYNVSGLLCHYSHLYAAEDVMDTVLYLVHEVVSRGTRVDSSVNIARNRLREILRADLRKSRRLLWHAGQIAAIAHEFLVSAPCEVMRLFMGYIFIVAFSKYCPRWPSSRGTRVQIDSSQHKSIYHPDVQRWIEEGGQTSMRFAEDIFRDREAVAQDARAIMRRLGCWGLSEKFAKIIQSFEENDR